MMSAGYSTFVIPAKAGTQGNKLCSFLLWIPAFAGMTGEV